MQPADNAEQHADKTGREDAPVGYSSGIKLHQRGLQTGKLSTPEIKLLGEIKTLGKQVMTVDELLVCLFLMIMSSDQS